MRSGPGSALGYGGSRRAAVGLGAVGLGAVGLDQEHTGPSWTAEQLKKRLRDWAAGAIPGQPLSVAMYRRNITSPSKITFAVYCATCKRSQCGWRAWAVYAIHGKQLQVRALPRRTHGKFHRVYGNRKGSLTQTQKMLTLAFARQHKKFSLQQLLVHLSEKKQKVSEKAVSRYVRNVFGRRADEFGQASRDCTSAKSGVGEWQG